MSIEYVTFEIYEHLANLYAELAPIMSCNLAVYREFIESSADRSKQIIIRRRPIAFPQVLLSPNIILGYVTVTIVDGKIRRWEARHPKCIVLLMGREEWEIRVIVKLGYVLPNLAVIGIVACWKPMIGG